MRNSAQSGGVQALPQSRDISVKFHWLPTRTLSLYTRGILCYVGPFASPISSHRQITMNRRNRNSKEEERRADVGMHNTSTLEKMSVIELARNFPFPCQHFLKCLSWCIPTARESQATYQACKWISGELHKNNCKIFLTD